jgi:hypothetical protein
MSENTYSAPTARNTHEGRVAVVTGAARGLGAAIARGLARRPLQIWVSRLRLCARDLLITSWIFRIFDERILVGCFD